MPVDMYHLTINIVQAGQWVCATYVSVGFCVARSSLQGNAKASIQGTGDDTVSYASFHA